MLGPEKAQREELPPTHRRRTDRGKEWRLLLCSEVELAWMLSRSGVGLRGSGGAGLLGRSGVLIDLVKGKGVCFSCCFLVVGLLNRFLLAQAPPPSSPKPPQ